MGSVRFNRQRQAWFIDYVDASGRRIRQTIGAGDENKRLAKRVLAQREAEAQLGIHRLPAARTPTFQEFAADWLQRIRARVKPKTWESYDDAVQHLAAAFGGVRLGGLTRHEIETWLAGEHRSRPRPKQRKAPPLLSPTSVNYTLHILRAILKDAVEHGYMTDNPAVKVPLLQSDNRADVLHFLTPQEIGRLLEVVEQPWRTLYTVALHTGLRRGELWGCDGAMWIYEKVYCT